MKYSIKIIPCFLALAILFSCVPSVHAEEYVSNSNFYSWIGSNSEVLRRMMGYAPFGAYGVCPESGDGRHHAKSCVWDSVAGHYLCTCDYCGQTFFATKSELSDAYQSHVSEMPVNGVSSDGGLLWYPTLSDLDDSDSFYIFSNSIGSKVLPFEGTGPGQLFHKYWGGFDCISFEISPVQSGKYIYIFDTGKLSSKISLKVPVSGVYTTIRSRNYATYFTGKYDDVVFVDSYHSAGLWGTFKAGTSHDYTTYGVSPHLAAVSFISGTYYFPAFSVVPDTDVLAGHENDFLPSSRPVSVIGNFNYFDVNGNVKLAPDVKIVNENDNRVYNPVTNETYNMTSWNYDYSTRKYEINLDTGDTVNVTYGDENVIIEQGGETYNLYYNITNDSETCEHDYVLSYENPPSCTSFGSRLYTCSKCNDTYTETIPVLGHDFQYVERVPAVVDESGNETRASYDLYRCSRCNEEMQVDVGVKPPDDQPDIPADADKWSGLFKWLNDFKSWLGGQLGGDTSIEFNQDGDKNNIIVTVEDENGEKQDISFESIRAKFAWWRDVAQIGSMFLEEVSASEQQAYAYNTMMLRSGAPTGAPSIKIDLGAAQSNYGYQYGGEVEMLDLSWYTPYKRTVDDLISGFLWLLFLWNLFKRAPSIISGGEMVASKSEDLNKGFKPKKRG